MCWIFFFFSFFFSWDATCNNFRFSQVCFIKCLEWIQSINSVSRGICSWYRHFITPTLCLTLHYVNVQHLTVCACACRLFTGAWDPDKGTDPGDEPQLHRVQIPSDKSTSLDKGEERAMGSRLPSSLQSFKQRSVVWWIDLCFSVRWLMPRHCTEWLIWKKISL